MKIYTIIGGVNGTGKSSLTGVLKTQTTDRRGHIPKTHVCINRINIPYTPSVLLSVGAFSNWGGI